MVLDELVYDPATGNGSMAVNMVEGAFSFISGEIAKTGPDAMTIETPVVTMGIRGTTVAGKAAVEGNENSFTLLQDADGGVGQISVKVMQLEHRFYLRLEQLLWFQVLMQLLQHQLFYLLLKFKPIMVQHLMFYHLHQQLHPSHKPHLLLKKSRMNKSKKKNQKKILRKRLMKKEVPEEGSSEGEDDEGGEEGQTEGEEGEEDPAEGEEEAVLEERSKKLKLVIQKVTMHHRVVLKKNPHLLKNLLRQGKQLLRKLLMQHWPLELHLNKLWLKLLGVDLEGASSQNPSDNPVNNSNPLAVQLPGSPIIATNFNGPLGPGISGVGSPVGPMDIVGSPVGSAGLMGALVGGPGLLEILSGPTTPGFGENLLQNQIDVVQESFFFDDPSLYNNFEIEEIPESSDTNTFYINGASDFGRTISDFSLSQILTINFSFDEPSSKYSVTRSNYYEFTIHLQRHPYLGTPNHLPRLK